jgi:hypothetical protein
MGFVIARPLPVGSLGSPSANTALYQIPLVTKLPLPMVNLTASFSTFINLELAIFTKCSP